jgi:L-ascorbate metabolism protein UlaG (beta-lactamase superfamily)
MLMTFKNRYIDRAEGKGFWRWQWQRFWQESKPRLSAPLPLAKPNIDLIAGFDELIKVTWVGHSTVLLQLAGVNILTDPHWGQHASPLAFLGPKRHQPPGISFYDLPPIHLVMISHNHYDHLDKKTILNLMKQAEKPPIFVVPKGVDTWFLKHIPKVKPFLLAASWGEEIDILGLKLHFLAVQHWSARGLFDRYQTLWGSWAIEKPDFKFWFSGDLAFSKDIDDIRERLGEIDLAAIAIGGYSPQWFMRHAHMNPSEAVQCMKILGAKAAMAIHWGTFENLSDEPLDQPPILLKENLAKHRLSKDCFKVFKHGETMIWNGKSLISS